MNNWILWLDVEIIQKKKSVVLSETKFLVRWNEAVFSLSKFIRFKKSNMAKILKLYEFPWLENIMSEGAWSAIREMFYLTLSLVLYNCAWCNVRITSLPGIIAFFLEKDNLTSIFSINV